MFVEIVVVVVSIKPNHQGWLVLSHNNEVTQRLFCNIMLIQYEYWNLRIRWSSLIDAWLSSTIAVQMIMQLMVAEWLKTWLCAWHVYYLDFWEANPAAFE